VPGGHPHARFHHQYAEGTAPWDIGRPQPEIVGLEESGAFGPRVLDVGCGTGETALFLASRGHTVVGIDAVPLAIESARGKADERDLEVRFVAGDVLDTLPWLEGRPFDSVVDVGFFHALSDEEREVFVGELVDALVPGGVYAMLCFSDRVPGAWGPRRVSEGDIRTAFADERLRVREVRPAELHSARPEMPVVDANLAIIERV
jgi:cyclopropane fatty-acyl-phospholipid synthase-like methyltransferase